MKNAGPKARTTTVRMGDLLTSCHIGDSQRRGSNKPWTIARRRPGRSIKWLHGALRVQKSSRNRALKKDLSYGTALVAVILTDEVSRQTLLLHQIRSGSPRRSNLLNLLRVAGSLFAVHHRSNNGSRGLLLYGSPL